MTDVKSGDHLSIRALPTKAADNIVTWFEGRSERPFVVVIENDRDLAYHTTTPSSAPEAWYIEEKVAYGDPRLRPYEKLTTIPIRTVVQITAFVKSSEYPLVSNALNTEPEASVQGLPLQQFPGWVEMTVGHALANKGSGIRLLKERYPGRWDRIVAFGDDLNDLSLFNEADYSVAVANAVDEVKAEANEVTLSNVESGVIRWIGKSVL